MGYTLDLKYFRRRTRALINWTFLFVFLNAVLIGGIWPVRESHRGLPPAKLLSVGQSKASGYIALLTFYGCIDGAWQTFAWWIMGALSNDPVVRKCLLFAHEALSMLTIFSINLLILL